MPSPQNTVTTLASAPLVVASTAAAVCGMQGIAQWGPENDPFLVTSPSEFVVKAGPRNATYPLLFDAAMTFFKHGGQRLYINRTVGSGAARSAHTTQVNATDTIVLNGRYKGARGNTLAKKFTRTDIPAGTVASVVAAGSTTSFPVTASQRFQPGDQVSFTEGADVKRGIVASVTGTSIVLAAAITVPVGGYNTTTTILIENYRLDVYDSNVLVGTYLNLQTSPVSPFYFVNVIGVDDFRLIDAAMFAPPPSFAANVDTRPATDASPVALTSGADGSTPTDSDLKGTQAGQTGIWAWERARDAIILSAPGIMSIPSVTVAVYKEALALEAFRQNKSPVAFIVDIPAASSDSAAKTFWSTTLAATSRGIATWYPWVTVKDFTTNLNVQRPTSPYVMGLTAAAQKAVNIAQPAAADFGKLQDVVTTELQPPLTEGDTRYDVLYEAGINGVIKIDGRSSATLYGNVTADVLGSFREFHLMLVFIYAHREIKRITSFVSFRFNDAETRQTVERVVRSYFRDLYRQGVLDGASEDEAFFVQCNEQNNDESVRAQRKIKARYGLRVKHVGEMVEQTLEQDVRALAKVLGVLSPYY